MFRSITASFVAATLATPAFAQQGVPVALVPQQTQTQSFDCSGGINPILSGVLAIGASENCMRFPGMVRVINRSKTCVALSAGGAPLQTQMPFGGGVVAVGVMDGAGQFRSCLPPGDTALFLGPPGGTRITGTAYASGQHSASEGSLVAGTARWVVNGASYAANGGLSFIPATHWGTCGSGDTLGTTPSRGVYGVDIFNFHCR